MAVPTDTKLLKDTVQKINDELAVRVDLDFQPIILMP
jgi:hypothetical protein